MDEALTKVVLFIHTVVGFRGDYSQTAEDLVGFLSHDVELVARRRRQTLNSNQTFVTTGQTEPQFEGIDDPITCLELGEAILFSVSNTSYPVYDVDNLWNSNPSFDYGLFRQLNETQQLTGESSLFAFRFNKGGVYTFYLSNDPDRKIYIRVVEETVQCPNLGPFFPASPSVAIQLGIVRNDDILLAPNWLLIGIMLAGATILMGILVVALVSGL